MALGSAAHRTLRISGCFDTIIYVKSNLCCLFTNNKCEIIYYLPNYSSEDVEQCAYLHNSSYIRESDKLYSTVSIARK
jgi:hypothetical protein